MVDQIKIERSKKIKAKAKHLGFDFVGISTARKLVEEEQRLTDWLNNNHHGQMHYMENHFEKRLDPTKLVDGAKSVISLMYNYSPEKTQREDAPQISKYAYGEDYHFVIKRKLKTLLQFIEEEFDSVGGRVFVDSGPVLERVWARLSGLGWIGKHSLLINRSKGSFYFLAELIIDLELAVDESQTDHCGTCTKCIDACPTDAIVQPYVVDGSKCISYFTIELKDALLPNQYKDKFENWAFGCDICQDVCPWNRFSEPHNEDAFEPHPKLLDMDEREWQNLNEDLYRQIFKKSAVKRTKFAGLKRNITFLKEG